MPKPYVDYSDIHPNRKFLSDRAILVQAWKKAHSYIRSHNWYADSLELDLSSIRLRTLIAKWATVLNAKSVKRFRPNLMRLVPAPKSTEWVTEEGWHPAKPQDLGIRPLSHLSIRDQTYAMAVLICTANIVETAQGNPSLPVTLKNRKRVVSYGHRLVASWKDNRADFRWGNAKLYRQYFEDYQQFVRRPEIIGTELFSKSDSWAIVQADLSKFYSLIQRDRLLTKLEELSNKHDERHRLPHKHFFEIAERVFDWKWHPSDKKIVTETCELKDEVGLPQGLAASGFFANAYLLDFDELIIRTFGNRTRGRNWRIMDYCRYVDDMRFVVKFDDAPQDDFEEDFMGVLQGRLQRHAPGQTVRVDSRVSRQPLGE